MDFEQDQHEQLRAREFGASMIAGSLIARDHAGLWDAGLIRAMGAAGLLGADTSALALNQRLIGLAEGSADAGLALAWLGHTVGCTLAIDRAGTFAQRERWLASLIRGERLGALAHAEPEAVRARPSGRGWRLEGTNARVVNAAVADLFVVAARCDSRDEVAMFVVDRESPGLRVGSRIETSGLRTATIAALHLEGCELPAECRLGDAETFGLIDRWQRACRLAPWIGLLAALVQACLVVARERNTQPNRALLADLRIRVELCRHVQTRAAWRLDQGGPSRVHGPSLDLALAEAMLGDSIASITHAAANAFAEPLGSPGRIERLARDASTLARLLDSPSLARAAVADALLGQERLR